jgi:hypothetical protein
MMAPEVAVEAVRASVWKNSSVRKPKSARAHLACIGPMPMDRAARREPNAGFPTGPEIGTSIPGVRLPNQHGETMSGRKGSNVRRTSG